MIKKSNVKTPEFLVWLGFALSVAALLAFLAMFVGVGATAAVTLSVLTVVFGLLGMALSVWGMLRWVLLDTPKWLHFASIGVSVVNILFPIPSAVYVVVAALVG